MSQHELFIYRTLIGPDSQGNAQIMPEFKYRNEVLPLDEHAGEYVTNTMVNGAENHAQIVPLSVFNRILALNGQTQLSTDVIKRITNQNPLLTSGDNNLAFKARIISQNGIPVVSLDSIMATTNPFYYKIEKKAEAKMAQSRGQMRITPKTIRVKK